MKKLILTMVACLSLAACGAGSTMVVDPYNGPKQNFANAALTYEGATADVPAEVVEQFQKSMDKQFFEKGVFQNGEGLKVNYSFVQFEAGSQFARWFTGGIGNAGEASLTVKIDFVAPTGEKLSSINVQGKIGSGFFGGSISSALDKAAKEAAEYAAAKFR